MHKTTRIFRRSRIIKVHPFDESLEQHGYSLFISLGGEDRLALTGMVRSISYLPTVARMLAGFILH